MNIICNILTLIVKISQEIRIKYPTVKSIPPPNIFGSTFYFDPFICRLLFSYLDLFLNSYHMHFTTCQILTGIYLLGQTHLISLLCYLSSITCNFTVKIESLCQICKCRILIVTLVHYIVQTKFTWEILLKNNTS